jgi:transposase
LDDDDKEAYEKVSAIIKDKVVRVDSANVGKLKPSNVIDRVNKNSVIKLISMTIAVYTQCLGFGHPQTQKIRLIPIQSIVTIMRCIMTIYIKRNGWISL